MSCSCLPEHKRTELRLNAVSLNVLWSSTSGRLRESRSKKACATRHVHYTHYNDKKKLLYNDSILHQ